MKSRREYFQRYRVQHRDELITYKRRWNAANIEWRRVYARATPENFVDYLVCRTGGQRTNIAIASAAQSKGWKWNPYGEGFSRPSGMSREIHPIKSEHEVFEFVGLKYLEPWQRE